MSFKYKRGNKAYEGVKKDFLMDLTETFSGFVMSEDTCEGYPEHLLTVFMRFDLMCSNVLDFELDEDDFYRFQMLNLSEKEWMSIYAVFDEMFSLGHELNPFIYLFFYNLIYSGPFGEDIALLNMSDELLDLMGDEMKKLNNLFNKYSTSRDSNLVGEILKASKASTIPTFVIIHIADSINEHTGQDKKDLGDMICGLYITAIEKMLKKPQLTLNDYRRFDSIFTQVDNPNFTDNQINSVYDVIGRYEVNKMRESINTRRRIPNPRFRC